jgi:hypothetical protein
LAQKYDLDYSIIDSVNRISRSHEGGIAKWNKGTFY